MNIQLKTADSVVPVDKQSGMVPMCFVLVLAV